MVVGVKPLGHLNRGLIFVAPGQLKVLIHGQARRVEAKALGDAARHHLRIQHMVVQTEIVDGKQIQAGLDLGAAVGLAHRFGDGKHLFFRSFAFPKFFDGKFQLSFGPDSRIAADVGCVH